MITDLDIRFTSQLLSVDFLSGKKSRRIIWTLNVGTLERIIED